MTDENKNIRKDLIWRVNFVYFLILLFAFAIIGRILFIQVIQKDIWETKAQELSRKDIIVQPNRGDIISADGKLLVSSVPHYEVHMDLKSNALTDDIFEQNIHSLAWCLSNLFRDKSKKEYKRRLVNARKLGKRYFLIKRNITYIELKKLKKFPIYRRGKYKGGIIVEQHNKRIKPFGSMASRTLGYLIDNNKGERIGRVGLEGAYNKELKGKEGLILKQKLSGGVWMEIDGGVQIEPEDGKDLVSTIDVRLQDVAQNALLAQLQKQEAHHGTAVLMEVSTGRIKAIVNLSRGTDGRYREKFNYAVGAATEPGSTFKLASLMVALEDGVVDINDSIDTHNGVIEYYGVKMKDSHSGLGKITVKRALEESSNVAVSQIINENYKKNPEKFIQRLYGLGLNQKLSLKIRGEGKPEIKYPGSKSWSGLSLPWMSIGYETKLTPLQILTFYNAVANNGVMIKPHFINEIKYHGKTINKIEGEIMNPAICSESTLKKVQEMLKGVVEEGTAKSLKNDNYTIAGKTGTAQVANLNKGYKNNDGNKTYQASFVGYFPTEKPKYSCIVVVNSPQKSIYGSQVAGPVFKEIADKVYATSLDMIEENRKNYVETVPYSRNSNKIDLENVFSFLNIPYRENCKDNWVSTVNAGNLVALNEIDYINNENLVPNLKGMGLKDVMYLLENRGLKVNAKGYGTVSWQSIPAGRKFKDGDKINVELR